jgi:hypothetical protein
LRIQHGGIGHFHRRQRFDPFIFGRLEVFSFLRSSFCNLGGSLCLFDPKSFLGLGPKKRKL